MKLRGVNVVASCMMYIKHLDLKFPQVQVKLLEGVKTREDRFRCLIFGHLSVHLCILHIIQLEVIKVRVKKLDVYFIMVGGGEREIDNGEED